MLETHVRIAWSVDRAVHSVQHSLNCTSTHATQTVLSCSKPTLVKLCDRLAQFSNSPCALSSKTASVLLLRRRFEHVPYPPGSGKRD